MSEYKIALPDGVIRRNGDGTETVIARGGTGWDSYQSWLFIPGNVPDPADPPPQVIRYLAKRTIAKRLKDIGMYDAAFGVVTAAGKLQDWNDAMDIQAEPPDPEVLAAFQMAGMTQEQINEVLRA
jgi:hypothetical protein